MGWDWEGEVGGGGMGGSLPSHLSAAGSGLERVRMSPVKASVPKPEVDSQCSQDDLKARDVTKRMPFKSSTCRDNFFAILTNICESKHFSFE